MASGQAGLLRWTIERASSISEVTILGEVDLAGVDRFKSALDESLRRDDLVLLNLRDVSFIDSTGLRLLIELKREIDARGGELVLKVTSEAVERLLDISGTSSFFRDITRTGARPMSAAVGLTG